MAVGRRIAALDLKELLVLGSTFLRHPLYFLPTLKATRKSIIVCDHLYKDLHHENNRENAFRHALWNFLICTYCFRISGSPEKAVSWCKKITDLHERLSPNKALAKSMDLHNNRIGREFFLEFSRSEPEAINILKEKAMNAVQVKDLKEIEEEKENLVFIR